LLLLLLGGPSYGTPHNALHHCLALRLSVVRTTAHCNTNDKTFTYFFLSNFLTALAVVKNHRLD